MDPLYSVRGTQFFAITPGAAIVGPVQSFRSDGHRINWCSGFIVDAACELSIIGKDGDSKAPAVTISCLAGYPYHFACKFISIVSGSPNIVGWI